MNCGKFVNNQVIFKFIKTCKILQRKSFKDFVKIIYVVVNESFMF